MQSSQAPQTTRARVRSWIKRVVFAIFGLIYPILVSYFVEDCLTAAGIARTGHLDCDSNDHTIGAIGKLETIIAHDIPATLSQVAVQATVPHQVLLRIESRFDDLEGMVRALYASHESQKPSHRDTVASRPYDHIADAILDFTTSTPRPAVSVTRRFQSWLPYVSPVLPRHDDPRVLLTQVSGHWEVPGNSAQVGLILPRPILVSSISVALRDSLNLEAHKSNDDCVPRSITLWGLIDGPDNTALWANHRSHQRTLAEIAAKLPALLPSDGKADGGQYIPLSYLHIGGDGAQGEVDREKWADVYSEVVEIGMDFSVFIFRFEGYENMDSSICVQRIGLHSTEEIYV